MNVLSLLRGYGCSKGTTGCSTWQRRELLQAEEPGTDQLHMNILLQTETTFGVFSTILKGSCITNATDAASLESFGIEVR